MAMVRKTGGAAGAASGCSAGTAPADVGVRDSARDCVGRTNATASMVHLAVLAQLKVLRCQAGHCLTAAIHHYDVYADELRGCTNNRCLGGALL